MPTPLTLTVGPADADVPGFTNAALQAAVDRVAALGGGVVKALAGTYDMQDSLHLRSRVSVRGVGEGTVLRKAPSISSPLAADLGYGHYDVSVAEPDKFRVGMGVHIQDNRGGGFYTTVATLIWRDGDRFGLSRMLNHDYARAADGRVLSVYPVISGYHLERAAVSDLVIDGNRAANEYLNGCRGGGVFLLQAHDVSLKDLVVRDYHGDGISFQQCLRTRIEGCVLADNAGLGLHPGSGSVGAVLRGNTCRGNGSDGIFYCLRVSFSLCERNLIEGNGGYGISIGGRDTDHLIRANTIRDNAKQGVYFREGDLAMAGSRNLLVGNTLSGNCRGEGEAEIDIQGATRDIHVVDNALAPSRGKAALLVGPEAAQIVFHGNTVTGAQAAVKNLAAKAALSLDAPAKPLAVGPAKAPAQADAHLRGA